MNKNYLGSAIFILVFLVLAVLKKNKVAEKPKITNVPVASVDSGKSAALNQVPMPQDIPSQIHVKQPGPNASDLPIPEVTVPMTPEKIEAKKISDIMVQDFEEKNKIRIPSGFKLSTFAKAPAIDADTVGIVGDSPVGDAKLAFFSRKGETSPEMVQQFMVTDLAENLNMKVNAKDIQQLDNGKPDASSGFGNVQTWVVKDTENNKMAVVTLAQRADKNGSYLNVISGEADQIEANKGYFENQMNEFQAH